MIKSGFRQGSSDTLSLSNRVASHHDLSACDEQAWPGGDESRGFVGLSLREFVRQEHNGPDNESQRVTGDRQPESSIVWQHVLRCRDFTVSIQRPAMFLSPWRCSRQPRYPPGFLVRQFRQATGCGLSCATKGIDRSMLRQKYGWVESFAESLKAWLEIDILREQCRDIVCCYFTAMRGTTSVPRWQPERSRRGALLSPSRSRLRRSRPYCCET